MIFAVISKVFDIADADASEHLMLPGIEVVKNNLQPCLGSYAYLEPLRVPVQNITIHLVFIQSKKMQLIGN